MLTDVNKRKRLVTVSKEALRQEIKQSNFAAFNLASIFFLQTWQSISVLRKNVSSLGVAVHK